MRKLLSLALAIAMIISCISMVSFAAESKTVVEAVAHTKMVAEQMVKYLNAEH